MNMDLERWLEAAEKKVKKWAIAEKREEQMREEIKFLKEAFAKSEWIRREQKEVIKWLKKQIIPKKKSKKTLKE